MFGYVNICKPELKVKEFYKYKAYYCGLCKTLKDRYGRLGQMTLTYDMTFLIVLLTSLYESEVKREQHRCLVHPVKKHDMLVNEITEYAADMNIALSYHHFLDDWKDDKSIAGLAGSKALNSAYKKMAKKYPRQCSEISRCIKQLQDSEKKKEENLDAVSRSFGELMADLFVYREDRWENTLRNLGFYLGKYIYLMDAYDDLEKDIKNESYNPLKTFSRKEGYEEDYKNILIMMMAECTAEFEKLPCIQDIDILRNILYEGVWMKYTSIRNEKTAKEGTKA
ncbi:MAG: hypothetical protein K0S47_208 [Herbinix sp.]|nr:hypothetical protein [Herbinix sp.]